MIGYREQYKELLKKGFPKNETENFMKKLKRDIFFLRIVVLFMPYKMLELGDKYRILNKLKTIMGKRG